MLQMYGGSSNGETKIHLAFEIFLINLRKQHQQKFTVAICESCENVAFGNRLSLKGNDTKNGLR